jgi:hypothetical protein
VILSFLSLKNHVQHLNLGPMELPSIRMHQVTRNLSQFLHFTEMRVVGYIVTDMCGCQELLRNGLYFEHIFFAVSAKPVTDTAGDSSPDSLYKVVCYPLLSDGRRYVDIIRVLLLPSKLKCAHSSDLGNLRKLLVLYPSLRHKIRAT